MLIQIKQFILELPLARTSASIRWDWLCSWFYWQSLWWEAALHSSTLRVKEAEAKRCRKTLMCLHTCMSWTSWWIYALHIWARILHAAPGPLASLAGGSLNGMSSNLRSRRIKSSVGIPWGQRSSACERAKARQTRMPYSPGTSCPVESCRLPPNLRPRNLAEWSFM